MRSPKLVLATSNEDMHDQPNLDSSMPTPSNGFGYKNLGRKKSNPAWAFFIDLRDQGLPGIKCRHCDFVSDDRSPLTMKYHIKKLHNTGVGDFGAFWKSNIDCKQRENRLQICQLQYTRTRNTRHSLTSNTPEQTASKKGLKKLSKEDPNDDLVDEAPILSQEIDQDPSSSSIKTEEKEQTYSFPLKLEKAVAPPLLDYVEPHRPRNSNLWIHLGRFDTEEEMHAVRSKQKVSKRRAEVMKHGTKIRYRCNRWKRTKCAYQMYAYFADSKIDLYESGEHDHSGEKLAQHLMRMQNKGETGGVASTSCSTSQSIVAKQFKLSQEDILNNLLRQATNKQEIVTVNSNSQNYVEHEDGMTPKLLIQESNPTAQLLNMANAQFDLQQEAERLAAAAAQSLTPHTSSPCLTNGVGTKRKASQVPDKFIWSDESSKSQLMELASELDMIASFGEKRSEFTFTCKASTHKSVRFIDQGECVQVENMHNQSVKEKEVWTKGDWSQFLWAVRGKCVHYLLLIHSSTPNNSGINGVVAPWHKGGMDKQSTPPGNTSKESFNMII
uniref:BED-type domain-containing protein n=1 Tax=Ditylenchus dipsaci TaxID=166011 RepID=A0A915ETQ5_9BILA